MQHTQNHLKKQNHRLLRRNRWRDYFRHVHTATHCNTLQHTAKHCNTLQNTATHCNTLQHTIDIAIHRNMLKHTTPPEKEKLHRLLRV